MPLEILVRPGPSAAFSSGRNDDDGIRCHAIDNLVSFHRAADREAGFWMRRCDQDQVPVLDRSTPVSLTDCLGERIAEHPDSRASDV